MSPRTTYDPFSQVLHWVIAIAVVAAYVIGIVREDMPKNDLRAFLMSLHMSIGLLVITLSVVRMGWRGFVPAPTPVVSHSWLMLGAKLGHLALYAALIVIPVIGLFAAWSKGRNIGFFNLFPIPSPIPVNMDRVKQLEEIHGLVANGLLIIAGVHAAAAIMHQFILKDGTLMRMLPSLANKKSSL
jgi:cytochrome b561